MEDGNKISPLSGLSVWWLFLAGTVLLSLGWFMKPFPVFVFIGLAPFFAILDHTIESENFWEHSELILIGLAIFFFSTFLFDPSSLVKAIILAIVFTLPFLGFAYIHESFGARTIKLTVIFLWLGMEYAMVKIQWPGQAIYLADAFQFVPTWLRWNHETGYLGASAWILLANWVFYGGLLRPSVNWFLIFLGLAIVISPIAYSLSLNISPIVRSEMITLYKDNSILDNAYSANGELVARTCTWLSVLIVLFAVVKSRVTKK
jgi:hypothetical protein